MYLCRLSDEPSFRVLLLEEGEDITRFSAVGSHVHPAIHHHRHHHRPAHLSVVALSCDRPGVFSQDSTGDKKTDWMAEQIRVPRYDYRTWAMPQLANWVRLRLMTEARKRQNAA